MARMQIHEQFLRIFFGLALSICASAFAHAQEFSVGDAVVLEEGTARGVPLHRDARSSLFGYAQLGEVAEVVEVRDEGHWILIQLGGAQAWVLGRYVSSLTPETPESSTELEGDATELLLATCTELGRRLLLNDLFNVCLDPQWRIPAWVSYHLASGRMDGPGDRGQSRWLPDGRVLQAEQARDEDYVGTGFHRGHMAPAEAFSRTQAAIDATHVFTNAAPQTGNMNSGAWRSLETRVRRTVEVRGEVWVVTGNLFLDAEGNPTDPSNFMSERVAIPTHCFKAILLRESDEWFAFGFVLPNEPRRLGNPLQYQTTVDRIEEQMGGIDLFAALPDAIENQIEREQPPLHR